MQSIQSTASKSVLGAGKAYLGGHQNHSRQLKNTSSLGIEFGSRIVTNNNHHSPATSSGSKTHMNVLSTRPKTTKNCVTTHQSRRVRQVMLQNNN